MPSKERKKKQANREYYSANKSEGKQVKTSGKLKKEPLAPPSSGVIEHIAPPSTGVIEPLAPPSSGVIEHIAPPSTGVIEPSAQPSAGVIEHLAPTSASVSESTAVPSTHSTIKEQCALQNTRKRVLPKKLDDFMVETGSKPKKKRKILKMIMSPSPLNEVIDQIPNQKSVPANDVIMQHSVQQDELSSVIIFSDQSVKSTTTSLKTVSNSAGVTEQLAPTSASDLESTAVPSTHSTIKEQCALQNTRKRVLPKKLDDFMVKPKKKRKILKMIMSPSPLNEVIDQIPNQKSVPANDVIMQHSVQQDELSSVIIFSDQSVESTTTSLKTVSNTDKFTNKLEKNLTQKQSAKQRIKKQNETSSKQFHSNRKFKYESQAKQGSVKGNIDAINETTSQFITKKGVRRKTTYKKMQSRRKYDKLLYISKKKVVANHTAKKNRNIKCIPHDKKYFQEYYIDKRRRFRVRHNARYRIDPSPKKQKERLSYRKKKEIIAKRSLYNSYSCPPAQCIPTTYQYFNISIDAENEMCNLQCQVDECTVSAPPSFNVVHKLQTTLLTSDTVETSDTADDFSNHQVTDSQMCNYLLNNLLDNELPVTTQQVREYLKRNHLAPESCKYLYDDLSEKKLQKICSGEHPIPEKQIRVFPTPKRSMQCLETHALPIEENQLLNNIQYKGNLSDNLPGIENYKTKLTNFLKKDMTGDENALLPELQAENLVKWVTAARKQHTNVLKYRIKKLKKIIEPILTRCGAVDRCDVKYEVLTGPNLHLPSSEPYFLEPTYSLPETMNKNTLVIDENGKVCELFPHGINQNPYKKWHCNVEICNIKDQKTIGERLQVIYEKLSTSTISKRLQYIAEMDVCLFEGNHKKSYLGHPLTCHINNYGTTDLLFLANLKPHYPMVRKILFMVYEIRQVNRHINIIMNALTNCDISILNNYAIQYRLEGKQFEVHGKCYNDEDEMKAEFQEGFDAMNKHQIDVPINSCISCECLKPNQELQAIWRMRKPIVGKLWEDLNKRVKYLKLLNQYICKYCLGYFRTGEMPPTCVLNGLAVDPAPPEISALDEREKLLIQRAKAFQVVTTTETVSGQNKPHSKLNKKVIGRTFHLPLPVEETLKRLPKPEQCLIPDQEMYILVRGIPTKQRKMWESQVNLTNVYKALKWLKKNNHLYEKIQLPSESAPQELLNDLLDTEREVHCRMNNHDENSEYSNSDEEDDPSIMNESICNQLDKVVEPSPIGNLEIIRNNDTLIPPGFVNPRNSCYANAICQSLLSFECVTNHLEYIPVEGNARDQLKSRKVFEEFKMLVQRHKENLRKTNDCTSLRNALGNPFCTEDQQDADEFYNTFVNCYPVLQDLTRIEVIAEKACVNLMCGAVGVTSEYIDYNFRVPISPSMDINQLINNSLLTQDVVQCNECGSNGCVVQRKLDNTPKIIVCQLGIYEMDGTGRKKDPQYPVMNLYSTKLNIDGNKYILKSIIYHRGASITSGHYTCGIRYHQNEWLLADDSNVASFTPESHNGDPYMLFFELETNVTSHFDVGNGEDVEDAAIIHPILNQSETDHPNHSDPTVVPTNNCGRTTVELGETIEKPRAMLTQKDLQDMFYQQYTVYQINEKRVNKDATDLYQLLKVPSNIIDNRDLELDIKCFPDLFPNGVGGMKSPRKVHLSVFEYGKLRMKSNNSSFRLNIQYIFFLLGLTNIRQLASGIYHKMNTSMEKMTAGDYLQKMKNRQLDEQLCNVFAKLRNTPLYWRAPRQDVIAMIYNYGPATFFLTLSPSEYDWPDLDKYLRDVNPKKICMGKSTSALIAMDPVSCSRFIDLKFKATMKLITTKNGPLGTVTHYFWRREYQSRGTQHFHMLLWVEGAPVLGESTNEEVADFINKYITCSLPDKKTFPTLHNRVMKYQTHRHNSYCMRATKSGGKHVKKCRFSFPRLVTETLILSSVAQSIHGRRNLKSNSRLYNVPRKEDEQCINEYNAPILSAWPGNMDIQFIGEPSTTITHYVTKYQTKPESSYNRDIISDLISKNSDPNSNKSLGTNLWNIGLQSLNHRECGALEAADTLLGNALYGTDKDTVIRYVNVYMNRQRMIKNIKSMEKLDNDSTDIYCPNLVDTHYPDRPEVLQNVCLYDFAKHYDIIKKETGVELYKFKHGYIKKRTNPCILKHTIFSMKKNPENYFFSLLLLFKPWRTITELKGDQFSYTEAFYACMDELEQAVEYHKKIQAVDNAKEDIEKLISDLVKQDLEQNSSRNESQRNHEIFEAAEAMEEFQNMVIPNEVNLDLMIQDMNEDQKRVFENVTEKLQSQGDKLRLFVSGVGGTGKSYLIRLLRYWVRENMNKDVAVCAPTGIAAFNINGLTIHRLLQLPVEHGNVPAYSKLNDDALKLMRANLKNVALIIIDEISMVSNLTLMYINLRLCEIFDSSDTDDGWFGKLHVLLFGDLLQLPPVKQHPPFVSLSDKDINKYLKCLYAPNIWQELLSYDELTINMRQKEDPQFADILYHIRLGITTKAHIKILLEKRIKFQTNTPEGRLDEICDTFTQLPKDTVCVLPCKDQCSDINRKMLSRLPGTEIVLSAEDDIPGNDKAKTKALNALNNDEKYQDSSETAGLETKIEIKIGAKIMIRRNIDPKIGLVNGAVGTVTDMKYDADSRVKALIVDIDSKEHEIIRVTSKFRIFSRITVNRTQFPIILAYGITVHKSQGISLNNAMIDIGEKIFACGQTYVALSRVRTLNGLYIINFNPKGVKALGVAIEEYNRLYNKYKLHKQVLEENMKAKNIKYKVPDAVWYNLKNKPAETIQMNVANTAIDQTVVKPPMYCNLNGKSSYANAVCQCIFNIKAILHHICVINDDDDDDEFDDKPGHKDRNEDVTLVTKLLELRNEHIRNTETLSTVDLRNALGGMYKDDEECDVKNFLIDLLHHSAFLQNTTTNEVQVTYKCVSNTCGNTTKFKTTKNIITLFTQNIKQTTMYNLYNSSTKWFTCDGSNSLEKKICTECGSICKMKSHITKSSEILILDIQSLDNNLNSKKISITAAPNTLLDVNKTTYYQLNSAIFSTSKEPASGNIAYTPILRCENKWFSVSSEIKQVKWPSGSKNIKLLFYEKVNRGKKKK